jgi:hypothetical protein
MRVWSLHPTYLDTKGLVALWRETLLAKHVLEGRTKGYLNHPQLDRFKAFDRPLDAINQYLAGIYEEAVIRSYNFDASKFKMPSKTSTMEVTDQQMAYEFKHLLSKLKTRDEERYHQLKDLPKAKPHTLFKIIKGPIADWEIV